jgi:ParB-like chromosome segregation protein Spo0J
MKSSAALPTREFACAIQRRDIDSLRPNPKSARTHPKRKIKDLAKAIKAFGFVGVIVVD